MRDFPISLTLDFPQNLQVRDVGCGPQTLRGHLLQESRAFGKQDVSVTAHSQVRELWSSEQIRMNVFFPPG